MLVFVFDDGYLSGGLMVLLDLLEGLSVGFGEGAHLWWFRFFEILTISLEDVGFNPVFVVILFFPFGFFVDKSTKKVASEVGWKDTLDKRGSTFRRESLQ
jgi:hypothetical protein